MRLKLRLQVRFAVCHRIVLVLSNLPLRLSHPYVPGAPIRVPPSARNSQKSAPGGQGDGARNQQGFCGIYMPLSRLHISLYAHHVQRLVYET
jgi:hypothetical protein